MYHYSLCLRVVTEAAFQDSNNSLHFSAFLFYILSTVVSWIRLAVHKFFIMPHSIRQDYVARDDRQTLLQANHSDDHRPQTIWTQALESRWMKTAKDKGRKFLFFTQLSIFPGILTDIEVGLSPLPVDADRWRFVSLV